MSGAEWDDFERRPTDQRGEQELDEANEESEPDQSDSKDAGCNWGFKRPETQFGDCDSAELNSESSKFCQLYERYMEDRTSLPNETPNAHLYTKDPQRTIRDWFENNGHEFALKTDRADVNNHICSLDIPIDDSDLTITSDTHEKKQDAVNEVLMAACRMLDATDLLYSSKSEQEDTQERKRRIAEAIKEDDIEYDEDRAHKRHCDSSSTSKGKPNTYQSLMARWNELNMTIIQSKARLVKLNTSITWNEAKNDPPDEGDDDSEEIDPLDAFMSELKVKKELSRDEKIEKSRIKSEIAKYEREQQELTRLIELAKPSFDLNKACPKSRDISSSR